MTKKYIIIEDMSWPMPDNELEWKLRYGNPTRTEILQAASILSAYSQMTLFDTKKKRDKICKKITDEAIEEDLDE